MLRNDSGGFTLVEILIVVAIIVLLATIAIPSFTLTRIKSHAAVCVNNLRQIDGCYVQYFMAEGTEPASVADLVGDYLKQVPICITGGSYTLPASGGGGASIASCSVGSTISAEHPHQLGPDPAP